jgi:hypothetical protein
MPVEDRRRFLEALLAGGWGSFGLSKAKNQEPKLYEIQKRSKRLADLLVHHSASQP